MYNNKQREKENQELFLKSNGVNSIYDAQFDIKTINKYIQIIKSRIISVNENSLDDNDFIYYLSDINLLSNLIIELSKITKEISLIEEALKLIDKLENYHKSDFPMNLYLKSQCYFLMHTYENFSFSKKDNLEKAIELCEKIINLEDSTVFLIIIIKFLSFMYIELSKISEKKINLEKVIKLCEKYSNINNIKLSNPIDEILAIKFNLIYSYYELLDNEENTFKVINLLKEIIEISKKFHINEYFLSQIKINLSTINRKLYKKSNNINYLYDSLFISENLLKNCTNDYLLLQIYVNLAEIYFSLSSIEKQDIHIPIELFFRAIDIAKKINDNFSLGFLFTRLGDCFLFLMNQQMLGKNIDKIDENTHINLIGSYNEALKVFMNFFSYDSLETVSGNIQFMYFMMPKSYTYSYLKEYIDRLEKRKINLINTESK